MPKAAPAKKAAPKKAVTKKAPPVVKKAQAPAPVKQEGAVHLIVQVNGITHDIVTDRVGETLRSIKPEKVNTLVKVSAQRTEGGKLVERMFNIPRARLLFNNPMTARIVEKAILMGLGLPYGNTGN